MTAVFKGLLVAGTAAWWSTIAFAQSPPSPDWTALQRETLEHFQALVRFDTQDPPGREQEAADYLQQVLSREGIPVQVFTLDKGRPNIVARLKGTGRKRPLRTGEVSSQGRKNSTMIEPNIRITPISLAGMNSTSKVIARRIA